MTRTEKLIVRQIKEEDFVLTLHARERMNERNITDADIVEVARTLKSIKRQELNNTYLLTGLSTWGEKMKVSAGLRDQVIIVTVFLED